MCVCVCVCACVCVCVCVHIFMMSSCCVLFLCIFHCRHNTAPPLTEDELKQLPQLRARKSLFVQELLLSMLTASSSEDSSDQEGT